MYLLSPPGFDQVCGPWMDQGFLPKKKKEVFLFFLFLIPIGDINPLSDDVALIMLNLTEKLIYHFNKM